MRTYVISVILQRQQNNYFKDDEFFQLAQSLSALSIKRKSVIRLTKSHPAFFLSKGHLNNIRNYIADNEITANFGAIYPQSSRHKYNAQMCL